MNHVPHVWSDEKAGSLAVAGEFAGIAVAGDDDLEERAALSPGGASLALALDLDLDLRRLRLGCAKWVDASASNEASGARRLRIGLGHGDLRSSVESLKRLLEQRLTVSSVDLSSSWFLVLGSWNSVRGCWLVSR